MAPPAELPRRLQPRNEVRQRARDRRAHQGRAGRLVLSILACLACRHVAGESSMGAGQEFRGGLGPEIRSVPKWDDPARERRGTGMTGTDEATGA
eukprot:220493-Lingulodinium_polyedra.AAC.1